MFNSHGNIPGRDSMRHDTGATTANAYRAHQAMGQGQEFDTIRLLMARWGDLAVDIGDDAAVLPHQAIGQRVVSTDACVEGVHFVRAWLTPREVGARAAAAALSDVAAMGGAAECVLVALVVPITWMDDLPDVADGIGDVVRFAGARIVGGNLSRGDTFALTLTVIGHATRPVPRAGAAVGDLVVVTGQLGGPGAALAAWRAGVEPTVWARQRFAAPMPRLHEGSLLAAAGATTMMDISDGLAADARHLGAASGVAITIDSARLPLGPGITGQEALASGEEYELLATVPPERFEALERLWERETALPLTVIGLVDAPIAPDTSVTAAPGIAGHDHFRATT